MKLKKNIKFAITIKIKKVLNISLFIAIIKYKGV